MRGGRGIIGPNGSIDVFGHSGTLFSGRTHAGGSGLFKKNYIHVSKLFKNSYLNSKPSGHARCARSPAPLQKK